MGWIRGTGPFGVQAGISAGGSFPSLSSLPGQDHPAEPGRSSPQHFPGPGASHPAHASPAGAGSYDGGEGAGVIGADIFLSLPCDYIKLCAPVSPLPHPQDFPSSPKGSCSPDKESSLLSPILGKGQEPNEVRAGGWGCGGNKFRPWVLMSRS